MHRSIVQFLPDREGYSCGYCKSSNTNYSNGMWAYTMTVQDYQDLIDRGWRRSGQYCYKPRMEITCCPMYTIRCEVNKLKLSKSQKKIIKKMNKFLISGDKSMTGDHLEQRNTNFDDDVGTSSKIRDFNVDSLIVEDAAVIKNYTECDFKKEDSMDTFSGNINISEEVLTGETSRIPKISEVLNIKESIDEVKQKNSTQPGKGKDITKPLCKKAKVIRLEKKKMKLGVHTNKNATLQIKLTDKDVNKEKSVEDFLNELFSSSVPLQKLQIRIVPSDMKNEKFKKDFKAEYELYKKYQITIHKDEESKCTEKDFIRFLVNSPLQPESSRSFVGYGSFHQQYWLDDKLIAVGVIDILPNSISSVYFFYDTDYSFLTLGTYGSLREIAFVRSIQQSEPSIQYYYMGFYIHSCQKMRYKGRLAPSYLLCPEVYSWHSIENCLPKLDITKYSRLNDNLNFQDKDLCADISSISILWNNTVMSFNDYQKRIKKPIHEEVILYSQLVGKTCGKRILLLET